MKKKATKKLSTCYVCLHNPPHGKCLICGYSIALKDIDPSWKARYDWLKSVFLALKKHKMVSTDDPKLDLEIVQRFGTWSTEIIIERDTGYRIVKIIYPQSYTEQKEKAKDARLNNLVPSRSR